EFIAPDIGEPTQIAVLPDITGDGADDLAVTEFLNPCDQTFVGQGRVYLLSGGELESIATVCNPGGQPSARFGVSVVGVPDVNGDGRADILVGASLDSTAGQPLQCGAAYVLSGLDHSVLYRIASPLGQIGGRFGFSVSTLPDLDLDGIPELLVGAYGHT